MFSRTLTLVALAAALSAPAAFAEDTPAPRATNASTVNKGPVDDTLFAAAAASGGLAEVSLSELGVQRATDPELKRFSKQMIDEHTKLNSEMMALASQKRIALPRTPDVRAQFCAQSLAGISGADFDRCYAKAQLLAHMDAVGIFEAEAERGQDAEVKALAAKALPHIKEHLKLIKPIAMKYEHEKPSTHGAADEHANPANR